MKACPVVYRVRQGQTEVMAFVHPSAGRQFVKGSIEEGETPLVAARRELFEESGLVASHDLEPLGVRSIGPERTDWHFFAWQSTGLPEVWQHKTRNDHGHIFSFFWHQLNEPLDERWHPIFHQALAFFGPKLACR